MEQPKPSSRTTPIWRSWRLKGWLGSKEGLEWHWPPCMKSLNSWEHNSIFSSKTEEHKLMLFKKHNNLASPVVRGFSLVPRHFIVAMKTWGRGHTQCTSCYSSPQILAAPNKLFPGMVRWASPGSVHNCMSHCSVKLKQDWWSYNNTIAIPTPPSNSPKAPPSMHQNPQQTF